MESLILNCKVVNGNMDWISKEVSFNIILNSTKKGIFFKKSFPFIFFNRKITVELNHCSIE